MDRGQIEEVTAAGDAAPVGAPAAAVERGDAPLGAGADPASLPPPPPPARAAVEVAPAAVADEVVVVPAAAAAAAAPWYKDRFNKGLIILTIVILASIFMYDMGADVMAWWGKFAGMTGTQWRAACFLTVGDIASLGLIFSQSGYFRRMWTEGGAGAGLAAVVPPLAGAVNCGAWLAYGLVVDGINFSVVAVNFTGVAFNLWYTMIFFLRSAIRRDYTSAAIFFAVAVAGMIAAVDYFLLIKAWGWVVPHVVGGSGAVTGALTYCFRAFVTMSAAHDNRGAGGLSGQALASFGNALVWLSYAIVQGDRSMQISNGMGILCFLLHAAQLAYFQFKKPNEEEEAGLRAHLLTGEV